MQSRNGLIIRLIDIALIILFGFIAISDIKVNAQIKLPTPMPGENTESQILFVIIKVKADATFEMVLNDLEESVDSLDAVEAKLLAARDNLAAQDKSLHVLIEPENGSIIQATIDVLDLCSKLNLEKNIAYDYAKLNL
ncbi:MAG: biopolymer transporter ExbD [Deferribacteres bacterium]|nr:biopolymer transporter ExbD [candidate division KSB1 bacterium]MCB9511037.1 biopolymer transporter ExbD [Deferribacteres bacterium]